MPKLILCDERGNPIGEEEVDKAHEGDGKRHLAFVVLIRNSKNEILVQKRAKNKRFAGFWELPASHLFVGENWEDAIKRTLKRELGIKENLNFKRIFEFVYKAKSGIKDVENEFCVVFECNYNGPIQPNPLEVESYAFIKEEDIDKFLKGEKIAEWLRIPLEILKKR